MVSGLLRRLTSLPASCFELSANVQCRWSYLDGLFCPWRYSCSLSCMPIPQLLNQIPLASLAAILIMVGYKLTNPNLYQSVYRLGMTQFIPFLGTVPGHPVYRSPEGGLIGHRVRTFFTCSAVTTAMQSP